MSTLSTIIIVLLLLWILGLFTFHIAGSLVHILLIVAVVMILVRVIQGKNPFK